MQELNPNMQPSFAPRIAAMKELVRSLDAELEGVNAVPTLDLNAGIRIYEEVRRYEIDLIRAALRMTRNHQRRAAKLLGVNATTLNCKIKKYKIPLE